MKFIQHNFGIGQTIRAVIKTYNNAILSEKELDYLVKQYNSLNGNQVPKMGVSCKIPILYI